jgi:streptogramin lyase
LYGGFVSAIAEDGEGQLYIADRDQRLGQVRISRLYGDTVERILTLDMDVPGGPFIHTLAVDDGGDIWFALVTSVGSSSSWGLGRLGGDAELVYYTVADGLADDRITDLVIDANGDIWCSTLEGVSCLHFSPTDSVHIQTLTVADGLPHDHVRCICCDREGHLWFGTDGEVAHYDGQILQAIRSLDIGPTRRRTQDDDGHLWFATTECVVCYTPGAIPPRAEIVQIEAG